MRFALATAVVVSCMALVANGYAAERGPGGRGGVGVGVGGGGGGGGANAHVDVGGNAGHQQAHQDSGVKIQANKPEVQDNVQGNANVQGNVNANAPKEGMQGAKADVSVKAVDRGDMNRSRRGHPENLTDRDRDGFKDFDNRSFRGLARDQQWRYRRYGGDWWYWAPAGYWMYYSDGDWNRYYDNGSYQTYSEPSGDTATFNGPYYEDSNGFYYFQNGRRVYDSQIRRVQ